MVVTRACKTSTTDCNAVHVYVSGVQITRLILNYGKFVSLVGIKALTMNIHQLRHLVYHVRNWGPLWSFSCFGFESLNGDLKVLFHGTRDMSEQVG